MPAAPGGHKDEVPQSAKLGHGRLGDGMLGWIVNSARRGAGRIHAEK